MLNFGISSDSAVRKVRKQLNPWEIYDVKFKGCEVKEFKGKKDPNVTYKTLNINFENEDGYFTVTKFFPKDGDEERREYDGNNGGKVTMPSNFETLMAIVKQTAQVLNPTGFEKMQKASSAFKSFDDVATYLIKITDPYKDTDTKIKLIGKNKDGKVTAEIPRIVAINKEGDAFIADNYIGSKLFFSDYEETQRTKYINTKPTEMDSNPIMNPVVEDTKGVDSSQDDFDINSLF